jgi:Domain of unknown function (DUF1893)
MAFFVGGKSDMNPDLELAKTIMREQGQVLALVKAGRVLGTGERQGVADLLALAEQLGTQADGAALADRVVGKAAAMIARTMGVSSVYALLASETARWALAAQDIPFEFDRLVPIILNRNGDGPCPLEKTVAGIDNPHEAVAALRRFIAHRS